MGVTSNGRAGTVLRLSHRHLLSPCRRPLWVSPSFLLREGSWSLLRGGPRACAPRPRPRAGFWGGALRPRTAPRPEALPAPPSPLLALCSPAESRPAGSRRALAPASVLPPPLPPPDPRVRAAARSSQKPPERGEPGRAPTAPALSQVCPASAEGARRPGGRAAHRESAGRRREGGGGGPEGTLSPATLRLSEQPLGKGSAGALSKGPLRQPLMAHLRTLPGGWTPPPTPRAGEAPTEGAPTPRAVRA